MSRLVSEEASCPVLSPVSEFGEATESAPWIDRTSFSAIDRTSFSVPTVTAPVDSQRSRPVTEPGLSAG